jgi:hypothetical protein
LGDAETAIDVSRADTQVRDQAPSRLARIVDGRAGVLVLTALIVGVSYLLQRDLFVGFADEGYLWYGTWRTGLGEVPLRDFQSYDPGRYYWGAFWGLLFGDGLFALRASNALFAWGGLSCAALVLRRLDRDLLFLLLASLVLFVWMYPRHKLFEPAVAMGLTWALVLLIERPSRARHFASGLVVGLVACVGRNHGGYAIVALLAGVGFAWWCVDRPSLSATGTKAELAGRIGAAGAGVAVGYLPVVAMVLFAPGFWAAFVESMLVYTRAGTTNLGRPIPWLWDVLASPAEFSRMEGTEGFALGVVTVLYTAWPIAVVSILGLAFARRRPPTSAWNVLVAGAIVAAPYFHFAASRAGLSHLAQAAPPLLLALITLPYVLFPSNGSHSRARGTAVVWSAVLLAGSIASVGQVSPLAVARAIGEDGLVAQDVAGARVRMTPSTALRFETVARIRDEHLGPDDTILVVPIMPTFYAALGRRAPLHDIYLTLPSAPEKQREMIAELERQQLDFVLHCDIRLDGHDQWSFRRSHALVWAYIKETFVPLPVGWLGRGCALLERDSGA